MHVREHYREVVTNALGGFQLLEESLKSYLDLYYRSIRLLLSNQLFFGYDRQDIEDASLDRLIGNFSKACADETLIQDLRSLTKHRNNLAHRAFLRLYSANTSDDEFHSLVNEAHKVRRDLFETIKRVTKELTQMAERTLGELPPV